jgi:hypothetical protein
MARYQTSVQEPLSLIYGNAILEVQPRGASEAWINLGAIRDLSVTENITPTQLAGDNADIVKYVSAHTLTISFTQLEIIRDEVREVLRGAFDERVDGATDYTIYTGGRSTLPEFEARLTNVNEDGAVVELTAYRCSVDQGYNFAYQSDMAEDPIVTNELAMTAIIDQDRPAGRQLYQIRYEPAAT